MEVGIDWLGNYSRFTYDEPKLYFAMLKEQGKAVLDDEFNIAQEIQLNFLRRLVIDSFGNGSPNDGFKIVGIGSANDFTIKGGDGTTEGAGRIWINGYPIILPSDVSYSAQPIAQSPLTTPAGVRVDEVYLDISFKEYGPIEDPLIQDPTLGVETSRRLKLVWELKVAEGSVTPASYVDANNITHSTYKVAELNRTASANIDPGMVVDTRSTGKAADHIADNTNPHNVTAAQAGAPTTTQHDSLAASVASHTGDSNNPHAVTKAQIGLSNVTNDAQLASSNNLSDLANVSVARTNLGASTDNTGNTLVLRGAGGQISAYSINTDFMSAERTSTIGDIATVFGNNANYVDNLMRIKTTSAGKASLSFLQMSSSNTSDTEFNFRSDGNGFCDGSWSGGGADFAENFEWTDGNPENEDRVGVTVVSDGHRIRVALDTDSAASIIGAISGMPTVVGNSDMGRWKEKYIKDDYGRYVYEDATLIKWLQDGEKYEYFSDRIPVDITPPSRVKKVASTRRKLNPEHDENKEYVSREDRKEWDFVGIIGRVRIRNDQPINPNWIRLRSISESVSEWLVR